MPDRSALSGARSLADSASSTADAAGGNTPPEAAVGMLVSAVKMLSDSIAALVVAVDAIPD